ncbi:MAG TPA: beta-phosphoglucomutase [Candidatus Faecousia excrementigallinarum]|uniref:Beta-phosphoglucomutase n=1 Tax=Candidatus Faecousia excrementigallinarum TaxID=2840806 RepID=A0A9D1CM36_9FIRM|nr:beta-phosphoglucomutase [Candidatus Faecousia excrementigallinarum]
MKYKAVIFDLDGVLCHTDHLHYRAWKQLADRLGIPFDQELNNQLRGVSRMESLDIVLRAGGVEADLPQREQWAAEKNTVYAKSLDTLTPQDLEPSVLSTLQTLRSRGLLLGVGSSSKNAPRILERLGLGDFFDTVVSGLDIRNSKPDPEVFLLAAKNLGTPPKDCLVVEDAVAGVEAAHRGGMDAAAMGDAARSGAGEYTLNEFSELLNITAA